MQYKAGTAAGIPGSQSRPFANGQLSENILTAVPAIKMSSADFYSFRQEKARMGFSRSSVSGHSLAP
jgi:hypothetical protein